MKTHNNPCPMLFLCLSIFSLFLLASEISYSQSCNNSLNTNICSGNIASDFSSNDGSFTSNDFTWFSGPKKWRVTAQAMGTTYDYVITSPSYYKNLNPSNL